MFQAKPAHLGHGLTPGLPASLLGAILRLLSFDPKSKMVGQQGLQRGPRGPRVPPPTPNPNTRDSLQTLTAQKVCTYRVAKGVYLFGFEFLFRLNISANSAPPPVWEKPFFCCSLSPLHHENAEGRASDTDGEGQSQPFPNPGSSHFPQHISV